MYMYVVGTGLPNYSVLQGDYVAEQLREKRNSILQFRALAGDSPLS